MTRIEKLVDVALALVLADKKHTPESAAVFANDLVVQCENQQMAGPITGAPDSSGRIGGRWWESNDRPTVPR